MTRAGSLAVMDAVAAFHLGNAEIPPGKVLPHVSIVRNFLTMWTRVVQQ
jgi:hypothetical protein